MLHQMGNGVCRCVDPASEPEVQRDFADTRATLGPRVARQKVGTALEVGEANDAARTCL